MDAYISKEVLEGIKRGQQLAKNNKNRLRVRVDNEVYPILRLWESGFSVDTEKAPDLRGFVDLYDGARQLFQCLIIRSEVEGTTVRYEFKRRTEAQETPPRDYAEDDDAPVALLR
jgi:hypothetical protein